MSLCDDVRQHCAAVVAGARHVSIDEEALGAYDLDGPPPEPDALDPERHYLEGTPEQVTAYLLMLDTINFGSGWFPLLAKRPFSSGYYTVSWALADHVRAHGIPANADLRAMSTERIARVLGQDPSLELMSLFSQALRELGRFLGDRPPHVVVAAADGSAERLAATLAAGMPMYHDAGFYKRAQIVASDLALAGVAQFSDLDRLTIFADNLVPHVLRCDGVLHYDDALAAHIDSGALLPMDAREHEIRAAAVHACELLARRLGVAPRALDTWLWNRGQGEVYKNRPRHRTRTVFY
ncbi:MAG: queuosine salvage family protein [Solirubrobacteraceae bacterium]